jgi:hypothetical protein
MINKINLIDTIDMTKTKARVPGATKIERQAM